MLNMGVAYQISAQVAGGNQVAGLRREVTTLKNETAALPKNFSAAATSAKQFAGMLGIGIGVSQMVAFGRASLESAARVKDLSARTALSTTAVQKLGYAAKLTGADIEQVAASAGKMNQKLGNALSGDNGAIKAFEQLRLDPKQLMGLDTDRRFYAVADALAKVQDQALKAKLGVDIFGKGFAALAPMMSTGEDSARALGDELERVGGVISPEDIARLDMLDDTMTRLGITAKSKVATAVAYLVANSNELRIAVEALAIVFGARLAAALVISTREYVLNTAAAMANARAQQLAALQATSNVRAILAMNSASTRARVALNGLVGLLGGPLTVAIYAAGAAWAYTGIKLDENITRMNALRAVGIKLAGDYERGRFIRQNSRFSLFGGGMSREEIAAGARAIDAKTDEKLLALRTPDSETASGKAKAQMAAAMEEAKKQQAEILAQIATAEKAADVRAKTESSAASAAERMIKVREREMRQLDDFILKEKQANEELRTTNNTIGMTSIAIEKLEAARKLDDEAARATIRMQPDIRAKYLATTDAIKQQRLELMQKNYDERRTFSAGTRQALAEYVENIGDSAAAAKNFWSNTFTSMEDALVEFTKTGKLNFKDLASSIIDDIIRIQVRSSISGPLSELLQSFNPFGGSSAGLTAGDKAFMAHFNAKGGIVGPQGRIPVRQYAAGGIASSPQVSIFGEGDMNEAYVPLPDGRRIPVALQGGNSGGGIAIEINNYINGDGTTSSNASASGTTSADQATALARQMAATAKAVIVKEKMPGGLLA